jgi:hypothetical protein
MDRDKKGATHQGYFWVYFSPLGKLAYFDYRPGRGRDGPERLLAGFKGSLQCDGYTAYDIFEKRGITLLGCMAHARRKFDQALANAPEKASFVLGQVQSLYKTGAAAREGGLAPGDRGELRMQEAKPVMDGLYAWLKSELSNALPKSSLGQAIKGISKNYFFRCHDLRQIYIIGFLKTKFYPPLFFMCLIIRIITIC